MIGHSTSLDFDPGGTCAEIIVARREELGLTQRAAARLIGITPVYLCNLERRKLGFLTLQLIFKVSRALNLDPIILALAAVKEYKE